MNKHSSIKADAIPYVSGDKDMADFLADEIKMEQASDEAGGKLPQIQGFSVLETNGAEVALRKSENGET